MAVVSAVKFRMNCRVHLLLYIVAIVPIAKQRRVQHLV